MNHFPLFFIVSTAYRNTVCCVWERIQRKEGNSFEPQISTIQCRKSSINRFNKNRIEHNFAQTKQQPNETLIDLCALRAIRRTCITHRSSIRFEQSSILWTLNETENVLQTIWINHHFTRRFNYLLKLQKRCRCWTPCNSLCIRRFILLSIIERKSLGLTVTPTCNSSVNAFFHIRSTSTVSLVSFAPQSVRLCLCTRFQYIIQMSPRILAQFIRFDGHPVASACIFCIHSCSHPCSL